MKNVLILGAAGFLGSMLSEQLAKECNVIAFDRKIPSELHCHHKIEADFVSFNGYCQIFSEYKIDTVYHLISTTTPLNSTDNSIKELVENVIPTVHLLDAMTEAGVQNLIFASSGGTVYGEGINVLHSTADPRNPICSYGIQKSTIEQYLALYNRFHGLRCITARVSNPYGVCTNKQRTQGVIPIFINKLFDNESITVYGNARRDYIYIDDVINALILIGKYKGSKTVFNVGTGKSYATSDIIEIIESRANKKFSDILYKDIRKCDVMENLLNISDTTKELGWSPVYKTIEDGIEIVLREMNKLSAEE